MSPPHDKHLLFMILKYHGRSIRELINSISMCSCQPRCIDVSLQMMCALIPHQELCSSKIFTLVSPMLASTSFVDPRIKSRNRRSSIGLRRCEAYMNSQQRHSRLDYEMSYSARPFKAPTLSKSKGFSLEINYLPLPVETKDRYPFYFKIWRAA